jgi:hypothetical protein
MFGHTQRIADVAPRGMNRPVPVERIDPSTIKAINEALDAGEKAWDLVKAASPSNTCPHAGIEYAAARIRFAFEA